jgi:hypothetical protein
VKALPDLAGGAVVVVVVEVVVEVVVVDVVEVAVAVVVVVVIAVGVEYPDVLELDISKSTAELSYSVLSSKIEKERREEK